MNVAIFGLGRSGLAVAEAVLSLGGRATVYDEKGEADLAKPELAMEARRCGANLVLGKPFPETLEEEYLVVNPAIDQRHSILQKLKRCGIEILSEVEFAFRISKAPIIAITGTNGKSTTTAMTWNALRACGVDAILCGNIFGSGLPEIPLTKAAMESNPGQILVAEISSFQLEWVSQFRPLVGCLTSLSPDHMDRYDSFGDYAATKGRLQHSQFFVCEEAALATLNDVHISSAMTYGVSGTAARIDAEQIQIFGSSIAVRDLQTVGTHNRLNTAAAGLIAGLVLAHRNQSATLGEDLEAIQLPPEALTALMNFPGLAHRMESLGTHSGVTYINNSMCTNPAAVQASIDSVGKRVLALVGGVNKDLDFTPLKAFFAATSHQAFLFGRDAQQINQQMGGNHYVCITMKEAFDAATKESREGDFVMLAPGCASMDQFRDFRHRGDVFRQIVKDWTT
jgi:UDP-N-acetylmuramoylalanine--D-glutamate ligase